ncbi:MAG: molybdopterin-dependent oxidoreductase, partial [Oscillospiraceae bacterium]|nr:molybdopterin-dependent oxidoreductase [Oscillospiraceae bacterium]
SKTCPDSGLSAASRQHFMTGNAIIDGCTKLMNAMRKEDGTYRTYDEMVAEGIPTGYIGHYDQFNQGIDHAPNPNDGSGDKDSTFMYGVHVCLTEVDVETGKSQGLKWTSVIDIGTIGNKLAVLGQGYGGLSHSIGFALSEDYDPLSKKSGNIVGCGVPQIDAIPDDFNILFTETPRPNGPYGSSGCSEVFQSSAHMAVINAINNACGVRVYNLPATPDKVKAGWEKLQRGADMTPPKYFLGSDLDDEFDEILDNPI